jgi:hypothetical protein
MSPSCLVFDADDEFRKEAAERPDMVVQLCRRHEAEDKDYERFRERVVQAMLPEKVSEQKAELKTQRWTEFIRPEMEAFCVIVMKNYGNRWIDGNSPCLWLDGTDSKSKAKCKSSEQRVAMQERTWFLSRLTSIGCRQQLGRERQGMNGGPWW